MTSGKREGAPRPRGAAWSEEPRTIGQRVQMLRGARGLKQEDLSSLTTLSKSYLSEVENDRTAPGGDTLLKLAEALGTTTDFLLRGAKPTSEPVVPAPISIPPELARFAEDNRLTYQATLALLDARRLVLARRGKPDSRVWTGEDWRGLYEKLKDYLE